MHTMGPTVFFFFFFFFFLVQIEGDMGSEPSDGFAHEMSLHADYKMWWKFDDEDITVKIKVKTTGWVGWGLGAKGRMKGADMVIGWVDAQGGNHFHDRHATGNRQPIIDEHQDYELLEMSEEEGHTTITFRRKLELEDANDFTITGDTLRVLWAWSDVDPVGDDGALYHGVNRGVRSVFLLDYGDHKRQPLPTQYKTFDVKMTEANLPGWDTIYWCKLFKIPDMGAKKQHIFRIDPIIEPGNEQWVHHMLLFTCNGIQDQHVGKQDRCRIRNMAGVDCTQTTMFAWAVGGGPFYLPPDAGFSLNTEDDAKFLLLETHYDNPRKRSDIVDSSGARVYYTEELRPNDASVLAAGLIPVFRYTQIIPQQVESFNSYGYCSSRCIKPTAGGERPKIWAVGLHTHVHGRKVVVRLMNETSGKEVLTIAQDLSYDFNYQEARYLREPVEIPPNHRIDVECTLETMDLQEPLLNGDSTQEEMCLAYLFISPKIPTTNCLSGSLAPWSWGSYNMGWNVQPGTGKLLAPVTANGKTYPVNSQAYEPLLDRQFWNGNETRVRSFESLGEKDLYQYMCIYDKDREEYGYGINKPRVMLLKDDDGRNGASAAMRISFVLVVMCAGVAVFM